LGYPPAFAGGELQSIDRRLIFSLLGGAAVAMFHRAAGARDGGSPTNWQYRGFAADWSAARKLADFDEVEASLKHQIDIIADCGAIAKAMDFFKRQKIVLTSGRKDGGGHYVGGTNKVVGLNAEVQPAQKPILLHEMLHAYHDQVLPEGTRNPDILRFYGRAREGGFYPPDAYVLQNVKEFFAVTASLYLWGNVDRPPFKRDALRTRQPIYYRWLGDEFGVQKDA
jgi:hypothetical protein